MSAGDAVQGTGLEGAAALLVGVDAEVETRLLANVKGLTVGRAERSLRAVAEAAARLRPANAVVGLAGDGGAGQFELVAHLASAGTRVIVLGPQKDADLILQAMRAGAQEFVVAGEEGQLARALQSSARPAAETRAPSSVTVFFAAKGGMGATALSANLAGALARQGGRVCLVDLDLQLGDVLNLLDLQGSYGIADVVGNMHRLDRDLLDASIVKHRSGVHVLAQSDKIEEAERVRPQDVGPFLQFLRGHYRHVVVDGVRGFEDHSLQALDAADRILLVVTQEVTAVRNAQRSIELFRRLGYPDEKLLLVVNRFKKGSKITPEVLAESTGLTVGATVSNDFLTLSDAIDRGVLLAESAPRSPLTRDVERLAGLLHGAPEAAPERPFLSRFFSRG